MEKVDVKKELRALYAPSASAVAVVDVPAMSFLMVDGAGDPNTSMRFQQAVETLFTVSYTVKFLVRDAVGVDYGVMPLEGLWWMDGQDGFDVAARDRWQWTAMIMQPDYVTPALLQRALEKAAGKKALPLLPELRFAVWHEGSAVQILHIGPFAAEGPTIVRLHQAIAAAGAVRSGKHHEIYLSNFQRTAPEKLKTVLRQAFRAESAAER